MENSFVCIIDDMTCGGCVNRISIAIKKLDSTAELQTDLAKKMVSIRTTLHSFDTISDTLTKIGYTPKLTELYENI